MQKKKCIIKVFDEINAVIIGLQEDEYAFLKNKFSFFAKSYKFSPKFKLGRWDGKINFVSDKGKTYVNLLKDLIPLIRSLGYSLELKDDRNPIFYEIPQIDKDYFAEFDVVLGDHQVAAVNAVTTVGKGIIEAATSAGKSYINAALCDLYNKHYHLKTLTIVPSNDLVSQTKADFIKFGLDVGEYSGSLKDLNHQHVICTWQSVQNNLQIMSLFQMLVCDEAHTCTGKQLQTILNEHGSHIIARFGLTGTIPDNEVNAMTVRVTLGDVLYVIRAIELMELGWISKLNIKIMQLQETFFYEWQKYINQYPLKNSKSDFQLFKMQYFPDYTAEKNFLYTKVTRLDFISELIMEKNREKKGNCLILVNSVKQGKKLQERIKNSIFIDGSDSKKSRRKVYDSFSDNDDVVLIATYKLASTGLNIPRIFFLFFIDPGKSFTTIIQSIGRGLRKAIDKDYVEVYDVCSDVKYANLHLKNRIKFYKNASYNYKIYSIDYEILM